MKVLRIFKSWITNIWCYIFRRGVGFKPKAVLTIHRDNSVGIHAIIVRREKPREPIVTSFDKDGFTISWTKTKPGKASVEYFYWL